MSAILTGLIVSGLLAMLLAASGVILLIVNYFFQDDLRLKQVRHKVEEPLEVGILDQAKPSSPGLGVNRINRKGMAEEEVNAVNLVVQWDD